MKLMHEILGLAPKKGHIGLELEVEAREEIPFYDDDVWTTKREDSLRGYAYEYVTKHPIGDNMHKRDKIDKLCTKLLEYRVKGNSPRTSTHVHVNMHHAKPMHVWNGVVAYWLFDNLLTQYCGPDRVGNKFCLRLKDAEHLISVANASFDRGWPFTGFSNDEVRYSTLNLNALWKFGTLEFRAMRGTLDVDIIDEWSTNLHHMLKVAATFPSPATLMDYYFFDGTSRNFVGKFFTDSFATKLLAIPEWQHLIDQQKGLLCEFAYGRDWEKWQKETNELNMNNKPRFAGRQEEVAEPHPIPFDYFATNTPLLTTRPGNLDEADVNHVRPVGGDRNRARAELERIAELDQVHHEQRRAYTEAQRQATRAADRQRGRIRMLIQDEANNRVVDGWEEVPAPVDIERDYERE